MWWEMIEYVCCVFSDNWLMWEIVESDWMMMNNSLVIYYGYLGIKNGEFFFVIFCGDDFCGGGILGYVGL